MAKLHWLRQNKRIWYRNEQIDTHTEWDTHIEASSSYYLMMNSDFKQWCLSHHWPSAFLPNSFSPFTNGFFRQRKTIGHNIRATNVDTNKIHELIYFVIVPINVKLTNINKVFLRGNSIKGNNSNLDIVCQKNCFFFVVLLIVTEKCFFCVHFYKIKTNKV